MSLWALSIRRPVLATVMTIALTLFGWIGYTKLPVRELPSIDFPIVSVLSVLPGANPDVVEKVVTALVEAMAFSLAPTNKPTVLKTIMKEFKLTDLAAAERGYENLRDLNRKPYPTVERLRSMQKIMALHEPKVLDLKVEDVIDDRFVRKLDQSGVIDRLYSTYGVK